MVVLGRSSGDLGMLLAGTKAEFGPPCRLGVFISIQYNRRNQIVRKVTVSSKAKDTVDHLSYFMTNGPTMGLQRSSFGISEFVS